MKLEFAKIIGSDIAKQVFSSEVKRLLDSKAWKKVSEVIVRTLGKKVGAKVLQKMIGCLEEFQHKLFFVRGNMG